MQHLTVRNIPPDLATALAEEKHKRRQSLNQTVIELLRNSLGVGSGRKRSNGLRKLAGQWTDEEHRQFEDAISITEEIDEDLWR
ncbi:MAG: hypothetical protein AAF657_13655 [Acidobacteriota bacterium]